MIASQTIQKWIIAKERVATLDYGRRSITECGGEHRCTGPHGAQLVRAKYEAARTLRGDESQWAAMDSYWIRHALKQARAELKTIEAEKKAIGTVRQLRLAIAAECECYGCGAVRLAGGGAYYCDACIAEQTEMHAAEVAAFDRYHDYADAIASAA